MVSLRTGLRESWVIRQPEVIAKPVNDRFQLAPFEELRHLSEQYFTCSQSLAHFFRHVKGRVQCKQDLLGRSVFLRPRMGESLVIRTRMFVDY